jgi:immunity protein Imm1 of predicted polymorphic toxin system
MAQRTQRAQNRRQMQPLAIRLRATRKRLVAETEAEVQSALAAAEQEADRVGKTGIVDFQAANGSTLSMLVGGAETMLSWRYDGDTEPRFLSLGDADAQGTITISRDFSDRVVAPRWALIPRAEGLAALDEFVKSNDIPECVGWAPFEEPGR